MVAGLSGMECSIGLAKSDLRAISILINCGHYSWLQDISETGQILLKDTDLVLATIQSEGTWWYRTRNDFRLKSDIGFPKDCEYLRDGIKSTMVFEELAVYFDERTIEPNQLQVLLDTIRKAPLAEETKEALEVELGAEFRFAVGPRLPEVLNEGLENSIEEAIKKSLWSENNKIGTIEKGGVLETEETIYPNAVANVLIDRSKWRTSADNPNTIVLRVAPGLTGYVKFLSEEPSVDIFGNEPRLMELMNKDQVELYCGVGSKQNVYRLKTSDILGRLSVAPRIKPDIKW